MAISVLSALAFLPWLLFAIPSGAIVDRIDQRIAMGWSNVARTIVISGRCVVVAFDVVTIPILYVVALLLSLIETIYDSAARAMLPEVVRKRDLERGNAWVTATESVTQNFAGPPIGTALFAFAVIAPFLIGGAGWAISAAFIFAIRMKRRPARVEKTSNRGDIKVGVTWLLRHDFMRRYTVLSGIDSFVHALVSGILILYALETLRVSPADVGFFFFGVGSGALLGSVAAPSCSGR